ncbi:TPA: glycosyltransferase [Providencia rettgeri]|nr:glycosyltransferase [Providencia rettgeri]
MKILHISHSDLIGGASRASYRLHKAMLNENIQSYMMVRVKQSHEPTILGPTTRLNKLNSSIRMIAGQSIDKLQCAQNKNFHSGEWIPSFWSKRINASDYDIVNLHWINNETMSIEDIGRIEKPIVWTLHDMWPFCGREHVTGDHANARWKIGYNKKNRSPLDTGLDLDRWVWLRKKKSWKSPINIVAPSAWMSECVKNSVLLDNFPLTIIPNTLDTKIYKPLNKNFCREVLELPKYKKIILFGAIGGAKDSNKGYDLLLDALNKLSVKVNHDDIMCLIFGQNKPTDAPLLPFETKWLGHIYDDTTLSLIYNSSDIMIVPSRIENLPQTATEAQSCGIPVVAFNTSGLIDAVEHLQTGYLASPFDTDDMASGIVRILQDNDVQILMGKRARERAQEKWSNENIISQYMNIYSNILKA